MSSVLFIIIFLFLLSFVYSTFTLATILPVYQAAQPFEMIYHSSSPTDDDHFPPYSECFQNRVARYDDGSQTIDPRLLSLVPNIGLDL